MSGFVTPGDEFEELRAEGRVEGARMVLLRLGRQRFGPPDADTERAIQAITDLEHLERLADRLVVPASWKALLHTP
jgi:hypothetical protein